MIVLLALTAAATPLGDAVRRGQTKTVQRLLRDGADPNEHDVQSSTTTSGFFIFKSTTTTKQVSTPVHLALRRALGGRPEILKILLDAGADPDIVTRHRLPPLHHVAMRSTSRHAQAVVELLLQHGAQPEGRFRGRSLLSALSDRNHPGGFIRLLVRAGVSAQALACASEPFFLDALSKEGAEASGACGTATLLHRQVERRSVEGVRWALKNGADVNAPGLVQRAEVAPLHLAVALEWVEGVEALLAAGADPNLSVGVLGNPPLAYAKKGMLSRLVRAGARRHQPFNDDVAWMAAPLQPDEHAAYLYSLAAFDGVALPGWELDRDARAAYRRRIMKRAPPEWTAMASLLDGPEVVAALAREVPETCRARYFRPKEIQAVLGKPEQKQRVGKVVFWTWAGATAVGSKGRIWEHRVDCPVIAGQPRQSVWLTLGVPDVSDPDRDRWRRLVVWYVDGVVQRVGRSELPLPEGTTVGDLEP